MECLQLSKISQKGNKVRRRKRKIGTLAINIFIMDKNCP
jgi:hypothetical protein